ncbi:MAG TPA: hypothetical protein VLX59_12775, partial [Acidimicrobiales bacterium]|nr:hypothetical protein [Acidimicrobiales bacterium]
MTVAPSLEDHCVQALFEGLKSDGELLGGEAWLESYNGADLSQEPPFIASFTQLPEYGMKAYQDRLLR